MTHEFENKIAKYEDMKGWTERLFEIDADIRQRFILAEKIKEKGVYPQRPF